MKKIANILATLLLFVAMANAQQLDRSVRPSPAPAKEINIKDAKTFTLSNGLKVFVVEDKRAPIVYYSLMLDVKPALERDKVGMKAMFSTVIGTATTTRSKEQINKEIDLIGASASVDASGGSISFLKKYETKALELMSDLLLNPVFTQSEFDLNIGKAKSELSMVGDDASSVNKRVSAALTYGKEFPSGEVRTAETLDNIKVDDLQSYYNTYFAPNVARLVIVGDITEAEAKANVEKYFGKWQKKNVPVASYTIPQAPQGAQVAMVDKPGAVQSAIDVSYPLNFKIGASDEMAASVMSYILGGGSAGRLFQNLREQHSYTYGVYNTLSSGELVGRYSLTAGRGSAASVKSAVTDSAVYQILAEMKRMINTPISEQELKNAKAFIAGGFSRGLESPSTIAAFAVSIDKYKLPKDYYKTYLKRLNAITVADVQAAAKKYIRPENAWIVVTGDKSLAEGLKQFASNKTVQFYDINANPIEAPTAKTASISANEVISKYVDAIGGVAAIEKINDYKITAEISAMGQKLNMTQLFKKPNFSLTSLAMGGMVVQKMAFNGTALKVSGMQGNKELTEGAEFDEIKDGSSACPEMNYAKNGYRLAVKGIEKLEGKDVYVLDVTKGASTSTEYYDVASGLKLKKVATAMGPQGPIQQVTEYGDYRTVDGVKFPYSVKQAAGGMTMPATITAVEVNKGIESSQFE